MERKWITVKEAATLANRDPSRIYAWIREDRLAVEEDSAGTLYVLSTDVLELESRMNRRKNNRTRRKVVDISTNRTYDPK